jgi:DNA polymerase II large subunit
VDEYFRALDAEVSRAYSVAERARGLGLDPELSVEIPRAEDMASRVEKLLAHLRLDGIAQEIRALARSLPREEVALAMARRLAQDPRRGGSLEARLDAALRVGLAILTEGILVAPLEGLAEVHVREDRRTGSSYLELYYAGPIRAAGGTAQALSVLLADVVRREVGLGAYRPFPEEVERYKEEIPLYKHLQHLQYIPTVEEIETVVRHVPVCVSGEATEGDAEVSAFRDLPRVSTNGIRGGACLVIAEGLCQKAPKLRKVVDALGLDGWEFLESIGRHGPTAEETNGHAPKYLSEAVGGRPVLAHPNRPGAFRLVYGRARTSGLAACAVHPATMVALRHFVAIGTQVKLEYPGKAAAIAVCDSLEGPIVELEDGTLTALADAETARELLPRVTRLVDLGELLVSFGEFLENNRPLAASGYTRGWHLAELEAAGADASGPRALRPSYAEAVEDARRFGVPLHPRFLLFWHDLSVVELERLSAFVERHGTWEPGGSLLLPWEPEPREALVRLGALHAPRSPDRLAVEPVSAAALAGGFGFVVPEGADLAGPCRRAERAAASESEEETADPLAWVSRRAGARVLARSPSRVGARVGRPEKARPRKMSPNVHALFPLGDAGGPQRSVAQAARSAGGGAPVALGVRRCPAEGSITVWTRCGCGAHTEPTGMIVTETLPIERLWTGALERLHVGRPNEVKGVKGLISVAKCPEPLEKGILRAAHGVSVYQDGTARFDLTDLPLTHVRPAEIGLDLDRARALGYSHDSQGDPLEREDQLLELRPQDIVVSRSCGVYLLHLARFLDDELVRFYGLDAFYRAARPEDLIGRVVVALAPHTSGGVAGRLIGFTEAEACFAHPLFHAAKRRNCDGDEDSVTLLLDALVNFSRAYLPDSRGALMDKPLVLTTRLDPTEVDKEAHNFDIAFRYPLAFYRAASEGRSAKAVEGAVETIGARLGGPGALCGYGFTHDTTDIAAGPVRSAYREAGSMARIVEQSLLLTAQIRAVDVADAVSLVLNSHFLPDLMGNLKSFATQKFRCKACGASFRRPPLSGRCTAPMRSGRPCGGELLPTVFEGAVRKYLGLSQRLARTVGVTPYIRQRIRLLEASLATLFPGTPAQTTLESFASEAVPAPSATSE